MVACRLPPSRPPSVLALEAVIIFRFDVITVGANLHVDCRLSTPLRVHRYADGATAVSRGRRHWMDVGFSKSGKRDTESERRAIGVAGRRRKRFPVVFVAPTARERQRAEIVALGNEGATLYSDPVAAAELATSALPLLLPLNTVMVM